MIMRSSEHTLKFANKRKHKQVKDFILHYRKMVQKYINIIWNENLSNLPSKLDSKICNSIKTDTEHDSRIRQCAAKHAAAANPVSHSTLFTYLYR